MAHSAALPLVDNLASLGLDTLVAFGTPDEDAAALVNRTASRAEPICTAVPFLDRLGVRVGRGYAIVGPTGTGKTELLIQAAVSCILPRKWGNVDLGGGEGQVLMIDVDARFDPLRLIQVLDERLAGAQLAGADDAEGQVARDEELVEDCLQRFHSVTCHDSTDFLATLQSLPLHIQRLSESHPAPVKLVLIDSLAAQHWIDRACRAAPAAAAASGESSVAPTTGNIHKAAAASLRDTLRKCAVGAIATKWTTAAEQALTTGAAARRKYRDYAPVAWKEVLSSEVLLVHAAGSDPAGGQHIAAKWQVPPTDEICGFRITDSGLDFR
mmetsp:Transcript_4544/g.11728  ORF Transcript_4544/g.11728 Transcript_4544/m.11728 type:complete len:326 (-) Transcript_4544:14-991(-)